MRRAVARGRVFPQSYSIDRRYGRLSLKAVALFPLLWVNADDQGRLSGDPEEVKYAVCPNIDHVTKTDVPAILSELQDQKLILVYTTPKSAVIQILDWWDGGHTQWSWPSDFPPPDGWQDHLRYKRGAKEVVTLNWFSPETSPENPPERSPETVSSPSLEPSLGDEKGTGEGRGKRSRRGRGNSPESSGEKTPSPTAGTLVTEFNLLLPTLVDTHEYAFGKMPDSRETAQLRDIAQEISSAGGATAEQIRDAYREAATHNKLHISYVAQILREWLGIPRNRSP